MKKRNSNVFFTFSFASLIITGSCTTSIPFSEKNKNLLNSKFNNKPEVVLNTTELKELEQEYSAFSTKALTEAYLIKKIFKWKDANNGLKMAKEIDFARQRHPELLETIMLADHNLFIFVNGMSEVTARRSDSAFNDFMDRLSGAPDAPGGLSADSVTTTGFNAHWTSVAGATSYTVSVDGNAGVNAGNGTSFPVSNLTGNNHYFRVLAKKDNISGAFSMSLNISQFNYTGAMQNFTVPAGINSVNIEAWGAQGGYCSAVNFSTSFGGLGGYAKGTTNVIPGQILNVYVGGQGIYQGIGGFNGGGSSLNSTYGSSGGGATDIRIGGNELENRIIVAGGGGGASCGSYGINGGNGGGLNGIPGISQDQFTGGGGGTQLAGGTAGCCYGSSSAGSLGQGGGRDFDYHNAGGGGGFYGGGAGAAFGSAGGGSSFIGSLSGGSTLPGVQSGNGQVIITYLSN
jgi:hypothetical protein